MGSMPAGECREAAEFATVCAETTCAETACAETACAATASAQAGSAGRSGALHSGALWAARHCAVGGLWDDSEGVELRQLAVGGVQPPARSQVVAWLGQSPTSEPATGRRP